MKSVKFCRILIKCTYKYCFKKCIHCFYFKLLSITFIKGRKHINKNIQLYIPNCYKKLSRLLKVTAGQVSMGKRLEHISVCNMSVSEVKEFHLL